LSVYLSIYLKTWQKCWASVRVSARLSRHLHPSLHLLDISTLSIFLSALSICLPIYLSACLSMCRTYLSALSIYLPLYLNISQKCWASIRLWGHVWRDVLIWDMSSWCERCLDVMLMTHHTILMCHECVKCHQGVECHQCVQSSLPSHINHFFMCHQCVKCEEIFWCVINVSSVERSLPISWCVINVSSVQKSLPWHINHLLMCGQRVPCHQYAKCQKISSAPIREEYGYSLLHVSDETTLSMYNVRPLFRCVTWYDSFEAPSPEAYRYWHVWHTWHMSHHHNSLGPSLHIYM